MCSIEVLHSLIPSNRRRCGELYRGFFGDLFTLQCTNQVMTVTTCRAEEHVTASIRMVQTKNRYAHKRTHTECTYSWMFHLRFGDHTYLSWIRVLEIVLAACHSSENCVDARQCSERISVALYEGMRFRLRDCNYVCCCTLKFWDLEFTSMKLKVNYLQIRDSPLTYFIRIQSELELKHRVHKTQKHFCCSSNTWLQ